MTDRTSRGATTTQPWWLILAAVLAVLPAVGLPLVAQQALPALQPTRHDPLPAQPSAYWVAAPATSALTPALKDFARAVGVIESGGDVSSVAPLLAVSVLDQSPLADHVRYYRGLVAERQGRLDAAAATYGSIAANTRSYIAHEALARLSEVQEKRGEYALASETSARLLALSPADPGRVAHRLGVARERAGDLVGSVTAHRIAYYDYPLSADAEASGTALARLRGTDVPFTGGLDRVAARAAALYAAGRTAQARAAYVQLAQEASGEVREQAQVRVAAADVRAKQYRAALDRLRPLVSAEAHRAEAELHQALALRGLGDTSGYVTAVTALVERHKDSPYAEEALNGLALWHVQNDEDGRAAELFGRLVQRFPAGRFAERAAWKAGWWAYRHNDDASAIAYFDTGARHFPRSDYRPAWLYWSGRAMARQGDVAGATARLVLTATDYYNSYYGRLALSRLGEAAKTVPVNVAVASAPAPAPSPAERPIGLLLALGLHDLALAEAQHARRVAGDSPQLQATVALAHHRAGRLRPAINAMKRAYPQYLASGGQSLPPEVLKVIFPIGYAQQLQGSAQRHGLDPFLVIALAAQESTFDAAIGSSAGALGLMQIMPATGRVVARQLGIKPFSTRRLTDPEVNMAIGTKYFGDLMTQFGHAAYALAGYNAGPHRVTRWQAASPGVPIDEWIDDIPFFETQNYVKRILGTAEDYRRLYGAGAISSGAKPAPPATAAPPAKKRSTPPTRPTARRRTKS